MTFSNNVPCMVKILNILDNYDTNFYHVIKRSIDFGLITISFESCMILMKAGNQKPTINIKVNTKNNTNNIRARSCEVKRACIKYSVFNLISFSSF